MTLTLTLTPEKERLLRDRARHLGMPMEEYVQQVVEQLAVPPLEIEAPEAEEAEQARLRAIMAELQAEAEALVPDPLDSPTRRAARESPVVQVVVEKFRKQGFNL